MFEIFGHTSEMVGTVMLAFAALRVHGRELQEGKIDAAVRRAIQRERRVGMLGVMLIVLGYLITMIAKT